jgi:NADH-quinone oxidoreductase subunit C
MTTRLDQMQGVLRDALGERIRSLRIALGEVTVEIDGEYHQAVCERLRDDERLAFDTMIDLCGVDYQSYGDGAHDGPRFAVVTHLLSTTHNWRVRLRSFCADGDFPAIDTLMNIWPCANWYEREAFDFYGIVFEGHTDLRRILTDYGFVGYPFRKDFPVSGYMEMRYDEEQKRVIYQPVTIEPRDNVPRVIREDGYGPEREGTLR